MNIVKAIRDENLFAPYLRGRRADLKSWRAWEIFLRCVYGLPIKSRFGRRLVKECTGRSVGELNPDGYHEALALCGRRSGKSRIAGLVAGFESVLSGREQLLDPGEVGLVTVTSPTKFQSKIVHSYIKASLSAPMLSREVIPGDKEGFSLCNGLTIKIMAGDFATIRGFSQVAVIVDEICFFGVDEECKVKSDTELIRSIRPAVATTGGKIFAIGSKYSRKGWAYRTWKRWREGKQSRTLVWDAGSKLMNPTLDQARIDAALEEDYEAARSEYLNEWRDDVSSFVPRDIVEACVVRGRTELLRHVDRKYVCFVDVSGGRHDPLALCVGHKENDTIIIDYLRQWKSPCDPVHVIGQMCRELMSRYKLRTVYGDAYASEFTRSAFARNQCQYLPSPKARSGLYLELLGPLCSKLIELPDNELLVSQIAGLERRARSSGDVIDHPSGCHDDLSNVVAGVTACLGKVKKHSGTWKTTSTSGGNPRRKLIKFLIENNARIVGGN